MYLILMTHSFVSGVFTGVYEIFNETDVAHDVVDELDRQPHSLQCESACQCHRLL